MPRSGNRAAFDGAEHASAPAAGTQLFDDGVEFWLPDPTAASYR